MHRAVAEAADTPPVPLLLLTHCPMAQAGHVPHPQLELLAGLEHPPGSREGPAVPQPPPHRFSGGDNEPAQDARQGIGCPEGCPLNPHVLWEERQSVPTLHPSPCVTPGCPTARGAPTSMGTGPPPSPSQDQGSPIPPLDPYVLAGPPKLRVLAAPRSTHCKFIVGIVRAPLERP